jgi:hypothetical protein
LYRHDKPNEPTNEKLLSFVLFEFLFTSVSTVTRGHPSLFSLTRPLGHCGAGGSSIMNLQQREAIIGSPPLLEENWRTQGTRKQLRTTEIGPSFFIMMFISFAVKIHRSTITTVARPQLTGSGEPVTRAK